MIRATLVRDFGPLMGLAERVVRWLIASARLFLIQRVLRRPMHRDLPRLVIAQREYRP